MKTTFVVSRILLGLVFFASGLSGFIMSANPPPTPAGLPVALIVTLLWTTVALPFRSSFAPLFAGRTKPAFGNESAVRLVHASR